MPALFKSLSELLKRVEATKKRLEIIDLTANYIKTLTPDEIEPATNMMVGRAFPKYSQKTLDVSWSTLTQGLEHTSQFDWNLWRQAWQPRATLAQQLRQCLNKLKQKSKCSSQKNP